MATKKRKNSAQASEAPKTMKISTLSSASRLGRSFFNALSYDLANSLLGKLLIKKLDDGSVLKGRIVETECYPGGEDKASITYGNRRTPANEPLYMQPGTAFVYMTYGMYHCFNVSSAEEGGAVLLRALEPLEGISKMQEKRLEKRKKAGKQLKEQELCNGPSKLCMGMDIRKDNCNKLDLCENEIMWIEMDPNFKNDFQTVEAPRIGIDRAGMEWASKPFRFYIYGNSYVSKCDVKAEASLDVNNK